MKRFYLYTIIVVSLVISISLIAYTQFPAPKPVNVILIGIDTLRADHVGCYGYNKNITPRIDKAAKRGIRFKKCVSQAPWTLPSFSSAFTSLYPSQHGAQINKELRNLAKDVPRKLLDTVTLTGLLRDTGMVTQGFVSNPFTGYGIDSDFQGFSYFWKGAHEITNAGISFLKAHQDTPFFLYLHYNDPHEHHKIVPAPYTLDFTPSSVIEKLNGAESSTYEFIWKNFGFDMYDAQIAFCDSQIGRLLDELKNLELWGNTLIAIISDHGEEFHEHEQFQEKWGFDPRGFHGVGHGQSLYEELMSVVFIITGGTVPAGRNISGPACLIDVTPTILDYMNIKTNAEMEGISLKPCIRKGSITDRPVFSEGIAYGYEKKAVRYEGWKYIFSTYNQVEELYNLMEDPHETRNVIEKHRDRAQNLRNRLSELLKKDRTEQFAEEHVEQIDDHTKKRLQDLGYLN